MNYVYLNGPVLSGVTAAQLRDAIRQKRTSDPAAPVTLVVNSEGGDVYEGCAVYNMLRAEHVDVIISGMAASIASLIAMAGSHVAMYANSLLFIHHAWSCGAGNAAELQEQVDQLRDADRILLGAYMAKARRSEEEIAALLDGPNGDGSALSADSAFGLGLVDEVLDPAQAVAACLTRSHSHQYTTAAAQAAAPTINQEATTMDSTDITTPAAECGGTKQTAEKVVEVEKEVEKKEEVDPAETRISELERKVEELTAKLNAAQDKLAAQAKFRAVTASAAETQEQFHTTWPEAVKKYGFAKAAEKFPQLRASHMESEFRKGSIR